jgi:hypothetical protein
MPWLRCASERGSCLAARPASAEPSAQRDHGACRDGELAAHAPRRCWVGRRWEPEGDSGSDRGRRDGGGQRELGGWVGRPEASLLRWLRIPLIVNAGSGIVNADSGDRERSVGAKRR